MRKLWRRQPNNQKILLVGGVAALAIIMIQHYRTPSTIDPVVYAPLLETIAKGESGGNYNAYFGSPSNKSIRFTDMTIAEVLQWQENHVKQGNVSNAVGKYQIIRPTLLELIARLGISEDTKFDPPTQDAMAIALLERRGAIQYVEGQLTSEQFAANLAKEWAALPKATGDNPHESYYASDGINKSNITVDEMHRVLGMVQKSAKNI